MKVRISDEAQQQARAIGRWWRKNRPKAPSRFTDELREAKKRLATAPHEGQEYGHFNGELVRRILLEKTKNHIYYVVHDREHLVRIIAIHGAIRGCGPEL